MEDEMNIQSRPQVGSMWICEGVGTENKNGEKNKD